jgi:hypothetical protein
LLHCEGKTAGSSIAPQQQQQYMIDLLADPMQLDELAQCLMTTAKDCFAI